MKVLEKFIKNASSIKKGDIIVLKSKKELKHALLDTTKNCLSNRMIEKMNKQKFIIYSTPHYGMVYVEQSKLVKSHMFAIYFEEIDFIERNIIGVCSLPVTEDLFLQLKSGDRVLLKGYEQCIKEFSTDKIPFTYAHQMIPYMGTEVKVNNFYSSPLLNFYRNVIGTTAHLSKFENVVWLWPRKCIKQITFIAKNK